MANLCNVLGKDKDKEDPYWKFDKTQHFRPKLNTEDFFRLSGSDFCYLIIDPMFDFIQDKGAELIKGKQLSYAQKALFYWWLVDAQVTNGGFLQFYYNDYGKYVPTILKSLRHIGDNRMADLINRSYELYLEENRSIKDARGKGLEAVSLLYKEVNSFDTLDTEYYRLNNKTMKKIENYFRKNPNEVCVNEDGKEYDVGFTGDIITRHKNNSIRYIIPVIKGIVSGAFRSYYESGVLKEEIHYLNGESLDERVEYYENGNKKYSIRKDTIKNQLEHLWYYEDGKNKKLEHKKIDENISFGEYKEWYVNGQLAKEGTYISDIKRLGQWLEYHKDGSKKTEAEFTEKDFLIHNCWNEAGEQTLTNGTGIYVNEYLTFNGDVDSTVQEYKDYQRHGKQYSYRNGKLYLYREMQNGKEHGESKSFDNDGNLISISIYENGKRISHKRLRR